MTFAQDLQRIAAKVDRSLEDTVKAVSTELFTSVIKDTPVDTGRARGNWQASIGTPASGETNASQGEAEALVYSRARSFELGEVLWLTNNLPYARRLEYGWSQQAPAGMVRKNVSRIQQIVAKEARKNKV